MTIQKDVLDINLELDDLSIYPYSKDQIKLAQLISQYSEKHYNTSWRLGIEGVVWAAIEETAALESDLVEIQLIAEDTSSWWIWDMDDEDMRLVPLDEWKQVLFVYDPMHRPKSNPPI